MRNQPQEKWQRSAHRNAAWSLRVSDRGVSCGRRADSPAKTCTVLSVTGRVLDIAHDGCNLNLKLVELPVEDRIEEFMKLATHRRDIRTASVHPLIQGQGLLFVVGVIGEHLL